MHHFLWISHQFWVSPLLTLRSACVLIERKFTAIFARRPDPGVEFILCNTHIVGGECMRISPPAGLCTGLGALHWCLVICTGLGALHWCLVLCTGLGALHWCLVICTGLGALRWCLVQTIASQILSSLPHQCTQTNRLPVWNFPWDHKTALTLLL